MASRDILYGVEASYYAGKIRAYLTHKNIPFEERQADRRVFAETIMPRVGWAVIPVMVTANDLTLQDTSDMIDHYEARFPTPAILPDDVPGRALSYWLELLGDEWLKMPALHYRWNHNFDFSIAEFGRNNDPDRAPEEQWRVGSKIATTFHGWLPRLGVHPNSHAAVEADYLEFLRLFEAHLNAQPFLLGETPTLADFAFYGSLYAHMYRDPASGEIMRERAPRVCAWVEALRDGTAPRRDAIKKVILEPTLTALLKLLARDYVPILKNQIGALQRWLQDNDEPGELPRHIGTHTVALGRGTPHLVTVERALFTFDQWMLQRVLDVYAAASASEQAETAALFTAIGAVDVLDLDVKIRLARENFRLARSR